MLNFNNNHIFTGYLKQLLASVNLPMCRIYTSEFARHLARTGKEDPRVIESFGVVGINRPVANVTYLKDSEFCSLYYDIKNDTSYWKSHKPFYYNKDKTVTGVTRKLKSLGTSYDTKTHEYLGDFLRFIRDYYNVNLMPMYNCFSNKIYSNIDVNIKISSASDAEGSEDNEEDIVKEKTVIFDSTDANFRIYAFPVKLFAEYTIAIDSTQGIEMFCGFYKDVLDGSNKSIDLFNRTYLKVAKTMFNQPFIYDKLSSEYWTLDRELSIDSINSKETMRLIERSDKIARCDLANREQDLKLFIKVPSSCSSSITVLEGNFSTYNNCQYKPNIKNLTSGQFTSWEYRTNHSVVNLEREIKNGSDFKPISKLQLLAFNTGESYPFADRLIEYLSGSAITSIDGIADNIKRVQKVMSQNSYYFKTEGIWENQMQKIAYDYMMNVGPIEYNPESGKLVDRRLGIHPRAGQRTRSTLYDILGYVDRNVEKYYANWQIVDNRAQVSTNIHNADIYNGLYDI